MKYYRTWKESGATREQVTREQAKHSVEGSYISEAVDEMLDTVGVIPCLFAIIEVEND